MKGYLCMLLNKSSRWWEVMEVRYDLGKYVEEHYEELMLLNLEEDTKE